MFEKGNKLGWGDPNKENNGRGKGNKNKVQSRYRIHLSRIKRLEQASIENIEKAVNGEEVAKQALDASKFVVNTIHSLHKSMLQEELAMKDDLEKEEPETEEEEEAKPKFSLHMLPKKEDLEPVQ